ncbi:phage minor head protein [uncultured Ruminococcus sp.]|uniref:phage minor head protein n=1 Tax=uncultured Ruminococcus sp. TaxID=165186 RepID=UPI0025DB6F7D|nr:phage minor head protein [uncultured Ruminococcus sp.]
MATLWDYQNQLRKIAEHRTSGAEQEILAVYSSVLQRLQGIIGRYYTVYSNGEGTLSAADLRLAGQYKGFLQDVLRGLEQLSEPQQEAIRSAVESAYTVCYDGMAAAVKEAASGSTSLQNALHGLSASTPEAVAHIVEHPMQKLPLSHVLQKKRRQITHKIRQTISVGLANGDSYPQMANRIADALHGDYKKAIRVVRTEANRAINRGFQDVSEEAAHLLQGSEYLEVKEWCSAEDGDVRDAHRKLDGKVIPATEAFEIDGKKAQCPGGFGVAELDINCRCFLKYALVKREDFEKKHGKIKGETLTSEVDGGIIKEDNRTVRLWYHKHIHGIPDEIPAGLPMEERAKKAFELRNYYRAEARKRMADEEARAELESIRPNPTFEELVESKMRRKKMTREEAVEDIYKTAVKSNPEYDKRAGL